MRVYTRANILWKLLKYQDNPITFWIWCYLSYIYIYIITVYYRVVIMTTVLEVDVFSDIFGRMDENLMTLSLVLQLICINNRLNTDRNLTLLTSALSYTINNDIILWDISLQKKMKNHCCISRVVSSKQTVPVKCVTVKYRVLLEFNTIKRFQSLYYFVYTEAPILWWFWLCDHMPNDFISMAYTDQTTDFRKDPNPVGDLRPTSNADEVNYVELRPG